MLGKTLIWADWLSELQVKIKKEEIEKSATNLYKFFTKYTQENETNNNTIDTRKNEKQKSIPLWDDIESPVPKIIWQSTFRDSPIKRKICTETE